LEKPALTLDLEPCLPPPWAAGGHAQTVWGHILPSPRVRDKGQRYEIPLPDGDRLVGFLWTGSSATVVYVFHGLAGSIDSTYMHRTSRVVQSLGHSVFMVNHRGCGEGAGLAKGPYHSGRAEDLSAAFAFGKKHFPPHRQLAIGFSMSGNALLLLLAGRRGTSLPDAGVAVNAPIDLKSTSVLLRTRFNRVYDLKFYLQCRRDILAGLADQAVKAKIPKIATLGTLDNIYTAPAGGFINRDDYYTSCSTAQLLSDITTPTIVLTTLDDPFVDVSAYLAAKFHRNVHLHIEEFGGHMGYITRAKTPLGTKRWLDYALHQSIAALELIAKPSPL
jgi:predicted alpha/beta-fold hydrolase